MIKVAAKSNQSAELPGRQDLVGQDLVGQDLVGRGIMANLTASLVVLGLLLILSACQPTYRNHGYAPTEAELALVEVGRDTQETVAAAVGRPSAQGLLNDVGWFYVKSRYQTRGALPRQEIDRQVVVISFDDKGVVSNVERFGMEKGRIVTLSRRVTESNVAGRGFLNQLFGNIGGLAGALPTSGK